MDTSCQNRCNCDECVEKSKFSSISKLCNVNVCLKRLTELDLSFSNINKLPELIGHLVNIVKLNLSSNELTMLPITFTKFQHLTHLILSHNKFALVPQCLIDGMQSITTLDFSHNELLNINIKPFCIKHLLTLNISNNLKLRSLPEWLWSLECNSLESLDISFTNCLENIEVDPYLNIYGISKNLKYLNISNTNSDIYKLCFIKHLKNLRIIILDNTNIQINSDSHNYFSNVPLVFNYRFKFIESLSMSQVYLSNIGKRVYFSFPNLRFLNLSNNSIVFLPDSLSQLTNLEVCDFAFNQISVVPECFRSLKNLNKLLLNDNLISSFPNILEDLINLENLDLYNNRLFTYPTWNINSNIKSFDLEQNLFCTENIIDLNLKENYFELLKNLRLTLNKSRTTGHLYVEEPNDIESFDESIGSSSHWSMHSTEYNVDVENPDDINFIPEEFWDCNGYENTTAIFDPGEFKLSLMDELIKLEKPLTFNEKYKERSVVKNFINLADKHYFCPSDELPTIMTSNIKI